MIREFHAGVIVCKECIVAAFLSECCADETVEGIIEENGDISCSALIRSTDLYESFTAWLLDHPAMRKQNNETFTHNKFGMILRGKFGYRCKRAGDTRAFCYYAVELARLRPEVLTHTLAHKDILSVFQNAIQQEAS